MRLYLPDGCLDDCGIMPLRSGIAVDFGIITIASLTAASKLDSLPRRLFCVAAE
jgi:hypothetical protein